MTEGSLGAPTRHPIAWQEESYYDEEALDQELRRVFDICHGCRRCFNLCDSFPQLFDMIDESPNEEVEDLSAGDIKKVVDACTLCDMCFMVKCPYVPPHEFDLDFPHLMLRHRAVENRKGKTGFVDKQLAEMDRNAVAAGTVSGLTNWATNQDNGLTRGLLQSVAGIDKRAHLPKFEDVPLTYKHVGHGPVANSDAPAFGRKAAIYATCYGNFNDQTAGKAALDVLSHNGVQTRVEYPACCGMPKLENGDLPAVAASAEEVAAFFEPIIDEGYDIVALTPSCALMMKFEWPLILPDNAAVVKLAKATRDLSEYVVEIAADKGLVPIEPMDAKIGIHFACHSRAQNMGPKAMQMLKLIPEAKPTITERCSGHGGKWGIFKENFDKAVKVGRPAARAVAKGDPDYMVSECPLAGPHLKQIMESGGQANVPERIGHPIELLAKAYGF